MPPFWLLVHSTCFFLSDCFFSKTKSSWKTRKRLEKKWLLAAAMVRIRFHFFTVFLYSVPILMVNLYFSVGMEKFFTPTHADTYTFILHSPSYSLLLLLLSFSVPEYMIPCTHQQPLTSQPTNKENIFWNDIPALIKLFICRVKKNCSQPNRRCWCWWWRWWW